MTVPKGANASAVSSCAGKLMILKSSFSLVSVSIIGLSLSKNCTGFGRQDFVYLAGEDVYRCPAKQRGRQERHYSTNACGECPLKTQCTKAKQRVIERWEHEPVLEAAQKRLDENPQAMRTRRETVEHPFGTLKMRMGATHFLMKTLPKVATEMALHVLAYNLTRVMNIVGVKPLLEAIRA